MQSNLSHYHNSMLRTDLAFFTYNLIMKQYNKEGKKCFQLYRKGRDSSTHDMAFNLTS